VSAALRLLWGLLLLLALAASPPLALVLLATIIVFLRPLSRKEYDRPSVSLRGEMGFAMLACNMRRAVNILGVEALMACPTG
jgi:hypothetical protein